MGVPAIPLKTLPDWLGTIPAANDNIPRTTREIVEKGWATTAEKRLVSSVVAKEATTEVVGHLGFVARGMRLFSPWAIVYEILTSDSCGDSSPPEMRTHPAIDSPTQGKSTAAWLFELIEFNKTSQQIAEKEVRIFQLEKLGMVQEAGLLREELNTLRNHQLALSDNIPVIGGALRMVASAGGAEPAEKAEGSLKPEDEQQIKRSLDGSYSSWLDYRMELGRLSNMFKDPERITEQRFANQEEELRSTRDAYAMSILVEGDFTSPDGAIRAYRSTFAEDRFRYTMDSIFESLRKVAPERADTEIPMVEAAIHSAFVYLTTSVPPATEPSLLTQKTLFANTELWERLSQIAAKKGNATPDIVYAVGDYNEVLQQLQTKLARLKDRSIVMISAEIRPSYDGLTRHIVVIDRVGKFRYEKSMRAIVEASFQLNEFGFELSLFEDRARQTVHFHKVSLDGGVDMTEKLSGKGLMRQVYANFEKILREHFSGWTLSSVVEDYRTVRKFMERLGAHPARAAEKPDIERYEHFMGTMNECDVIPMTGKIEKPRSQN